MRVELAISPLKQGRETRLVSWTFGSDCTDNKLFTLICFNKYFGCNCVFSLYHQQNFFFSSLHLLNKVIVLAALLEGFRPVLVCSVGGNIL